METIKFLEKVAYSLYAGLLIALFVMTIVKKDFVAIVFCAAVLHYHLIFADKNPITN